MKKADKPEKFEARPTTSAILRKMEEVTKSTLAQLEDMVEHSELDVFLKGKTNMNGDKIDRDEDITAEQVALLGGYVTVGILANAFKDIKAGKDVKIPELVGYEPTVTTEVAAFVIEKGKKKPVKRQDFKHLPKEVKDALKRIIEEMEDA